MFYNFQKYAVLFLGLVFIIAGSNHFLNPNFYLKIMPDYLPAHLTLVYMSGLFEILGGIGVLIPKIRKVSGYGLIILLIAVFPANIHMALNAELYPDIPMWGIYVRLPFQLVLIAWAYLAVYEINKNIR